MGWRTPPLAWADDRDSFDLSRVLRRIKPEPKHRARPSSQRNPLATGLPADCVDDGVNLRLFGKDRDEMALIAGAATRGQRLWNEQLLLRRIDITGVVHCRTR